MYDPKCITHIGILNKKYQISRKSKVSNVTTIMSHNCKIFDIQFIGDQPYEGGDDVAEPTVSSIGQKVIHLPVNKKNIGNNL